jgi:shikimate kinase
VLALGGGAPEHPGTKAALKNARVVYLKVRYEEAMRRVSGDQGRPLLARPDLDRLYRRRLVVYDSVATLTVDTGTRPPDAAATVIIEHLRAGAAPAEG